MCSMEVRARSEDGPPLTDSRRVRRTTTPESQVVDPKNEERDYSRPVVGDGRLDGPSELGPRTGTVGGLFWGRIGPPSPVPLVNGVTCSTLQNDGENTVD